jgi:uncharacterized membrane protein (DUF441 family)/phage gp46-like protein
LKQNKLLALTIILLMLASQLAVLEFAPLVDAEGGQGIVVPQLVSQSYLIPIVNGVINDVQVYASNVNGYRLYNALISIDVTWDGANAVDYLSSYNFLNWIWHLQQKSGAAWNEVKPSSMSITAGQDENGCYVIRQGTLSDGSTFTIKYSLPNNGTLKFSLSYTPAKTATYRLWFEVNGLVDGNTNAYVNYAKPNSKRVHFDLPSYVGLTFDFDYSDVSASLAVSEQFDTANYKYNWYVELGNLKAGTLYTVDPTTVSTTAGQYSTALGNSRKLFRDAYGKYIAVFKNANVMLAYCNNDPPTSGWNVYDLGSTYAVDAGEQFGVAAAYDSVNDRLMIAWVGSGSPKFAQVTFSRDSSHNIVGYTVGSVLTITPAYSPAHAPSLWLLHNGEVAAVWGADKTSGAKHSVVEFARIVFGSPPTYKNAAGTASSKDTISSDFTSAFIIRYPCIVQRTNSGTGQYDLYAIFSASATLNARKNKATWTGSAWTWGTEANVAASVSTIGHSAINYDVTNGLIVYAATSTATVARIIAVGTISADDTDSDISLSGVPSTYRYSPSLVIVGGDYYIFYQMGNDIYYIKRSGGSWSNETQFTTTANENYPNCKIDGSANRIELIWTHYTGTAYNVYYDYLSLAVADTTPPTYSNVGTNTTRAGQPCLFSVKWTDNVALSGFIFGTNNTGVWVNDTWTAWTGSPTTAWSNVTKTLNSAVHVVVCWQIWANDTSNNWNTTGTQTLTTTGAFYSSTSQPLSISPTPSRQSTYNRAALQPLQILLTASRLLSLTRIAGQLVNFITSTAKQTSYTRTTSQPLTFTTETALQKIIARYTSQTLTILTEASRSQSLSRVIGQPLQLLFSTSRQTSYNRLTAQALTLIQVAARQLTQPRTANQPITVLTQATRFTSYQRASLTPLSIIADALRVTSASRTANQQLTILLSSTRYSTYSRTTIQPLNLFTTSTMSKIVGRTANQALTILTEATRQLSLNRFSQQPLNILLSATRLTTYQRASSTPLSIMADALRTLSTSRTSSQVVTVLTETSRTTAYGRTALQTLSALTEATRQLTLPRTSEQQLSIFISMSRQASYIRPTQQPLSILTETSRQLTLPRTANQILTTITQPTRFQALQRTASQIVNILLSITRQATYTRPVDQPLNFLTTSTLTKISGLIQRYATQALTIITQATRQQSLNRLSQQTVNILLSTARQLFYSRLANQNFPVLAETTRLAYYHRASLTSTSIIANALRTLSTLRTASLQLTILTEASRTTAYSRTALQALSILTGTARQLTLHRSPAQALTILTATSRSQTLQRTTSQTITVLLSTYRQASYNRLIQQPLTLLTEASRHLTLSRSADQILTLTIQSTRSQTLTRVIQQPLNILLSTIRQATYTRQINQPINFLTTSSLVKLGGVIQRYASQALTILTQTTRQQSLNRIVQQPLNILLSISRQAFYSRTAEVLLQINMQTAIRIIIYLPPTPAPAPVPIPSIQLDLIIQTAHITRLWWQKTTTLEVLVINKGTVATDVTFEYTVLLDSRNQT